MTTYSSLGTKKIRVAVFFETVKLIRERIHDTLIWYYFTAIPQRFKDILYVEAVTARQIQNGVLSEKNFDVVLMPGGDAEDQSSYLGRKGRTKLCEFVGSGKGYVGICAGCYLALEPNEDPDVPELIRRKILDYPTTEWHYGLIPEITSKDLAHWNRGTGSVSIAFTRTGRLLMNSKHGTKVHYANGALMTTSKKFNRNRESKMRVLATYTSEVTHLFGTAGQMEGSPAIISNEFGEKKGRVVVSSCHIEKYPESDDSKLLMNLIIWASKQDFSLFE